MNIQPQDQAWLLDEWPGLVFGAEGIAGKMRFLASFNKDSDLFQHIVDGEDRVGGITLAVQFEIRIASRAQSKYSLLPALFVDGVPSIADRHFSPDGTACLCSPFEEDSYLSPSFDLKRFLKELVVPFLYGQAFFDRFEQWPWKEYSHGALGLLESYADAMNQTLTESCLTKLSTYPQWATIKLLLSQRPFVKGHSRCLCPIGDQIRRCHPQVLAGLRLLSENIQALQVEITAY